MDDPHEASLREMALHYRMPLRDISQPRPTLKRPGRMSTNRAMIGRLARRGSKRRLAVLDSTFPWRMSGFRYHEAAAILAARPDTLFFSTYAMTDPFPVPVYPLADFPSIALDAGVTDAYGVFLWFLAGLVGLGPSRSGVAAHPMEGLDLTEILRSARIRLHGTLLPGGGLTFTDEAFAWAGEVIERLDSAFAFTQAILSKFPSAVAVPAAFTDTALYDESRDRWDKLEPLAVLFAADAAPRKGLDAALGAFSALGGDFHLHVVGPHEHRRAELPASLASFHGWLQPSELAELHRRTHVFVSPVSAEPVETTAGGRGMIDGFPTQAAVDAMSSGCLLVSANPLADHRVLEPGRHYVECPPDPEQLRSTLLWLASKPETMREIAEAGARRVRERMDVRLGVAAKMKHMGLIGTPTPTR